VFTDAWGAYVTLPDLGIDHRPHKGGHGRQSVHLLPWAHTVFGNLKTWLRGTFHGFGLRTGASPSIRPLRHGLHRASTAQEVDCEKQGVSRWERFRADRTQ
jgi:hypothetical protein